MYGMNPNAFPGAQAAPTPGQQFMGQQIMPPQLMPQQDMGKMGKPMAGKPMAGKPMVGKPMVGQPPLGPIGGPMFPGVLPVEETYVENILRANRGKVATVYTTNENNPQWAAKVFKGRVENAARDHVVLSDPETGMRYIVLMVNIDYITFDEPLRFEPGIYRM